MSESKESEQHEKDMLNMFASVWVKVEVDEDDENNSENSLLAEPVMIKRKKTLNDRNKRSLKCDICDYTTIYKNCLNLHILGHTNTKPYSCDICEYTTKYPNSLHRHVMIQHELKTAQEKLDNFNCDECPYSTVFKWNLKAHKRKHKLEKQYKCDQCNYATAYRHNYMKHSKVHNKQEVIFKCDKCPFITKYEGHIARHLAKIHNEVSEKANKCDLCDFSTKVRWRLNVHKRRSKQKDVIKCSSCEFETSYMCESKKHKSIHYNDTTDYQLNESSGEITFDAPEFQPAPNPVVNIDDPNISVHEKCNNYMLDPELIVADNKIESLKIPVGDKVITSEIIQNIREQNISLEDILDSPEVKDFASIMNSPQKTNSGLL
ncbi:hypothetical protein PYW07_011546 [Mythimna separata]|uniref:C2H2-type domain-containing protein n=1 Tax=Mythimna separata TaxID=271217 RepID=A0AAD7YA23_MYTSE|nr:hypothetical protein PYW07_011546 [Mythimna separata]